jgi:uncharacterized membrane protein YhaH (DUF805 family)
MHWYTDVLKKYADFTGRARRTEFWMYFLINFIIIIVLAAIDFYFNLTIAGTVGILENLYGLAVFIPNIAVSVRRLHDTGRTGWWVLLALIPCVGLILLVFWVQDSQPGSNQYGPNPKSVAA